jgi:predicted  nucleic acid-binding Zn-ribbon protein
MPENDTTTTDAATTATDVATSTTDSQVSDDKTLGPAGEKALEEWKTRAKAAEAEAKAAKALRAQLQEYQDKDKSELQKATDRAAAAEKAAAETQRDLLRHKVGIAKQLPAELVGRLQGDTEDEMQADASRLADLIKQNTRPQGDLDQGGRSRSVASSPAQEFAHLMQAQLQRPPS